MRGEVFLVPLEWSTEVQMQKQHNRKEINGGFILTDGVTGMSSEAGQMKSGWEGC